MMFLEGTCAPLIHAVFGEGKASVLELGGGPTLYQLMNIARAVKEIHFTDYVEDNLAEVRLWKSGSRSAFDWTSFLRAALMLEKDSAEVSKKEAAALAKELRRKIKSVKTCDIFKKDLGVARRPYDIISTHFVAESATSSKAHWEAALKNIHRKLAKNGLLFMSALRGAKGSYKVLEQKFPAVKLYESDMEKGLKKAGFKVIRISSIRTEDKSNNYDGFMFVVAQKQ